MMNKVVSIKRGRFLGADSYGHNSARSPAELFFVTGGILAVGLPQIILGIYGGLTPFITLAVSTLAGLILGLVMYRHLQYRPLSLVAAGLVSRFTPRAVNKRHDKTAA